MCEKFSVAADRDAVSKILLGTDRTSNLCLPRTKVQTPGGKHKSGCSHQYLGTVRHSSHAGNGGNSPEIQVSRCR